MNNSKLIAQKIENIKKDLCASWSEKITRALFPKNGLVTPRGTPRNDMPVDEPKAPTPEQATEQNPPTDAVQPTTEAVENAPQTTDVAPQPATTEPASTTEQQQQPPATATDDGSKQPSTEKKPRTLVISDEIEERTITVEFEWTSFNDLFSSLINEGAADVIDTIMESLVSKDCAISLLSSLLEHCKPLTGLEGLACCCF